MQLAGGWITPSTQSYYIVYEKGYKKQISSFDKIHIQEYSFVRGSYDENSNKLLEDVEDYELQIYAKNIVELIRRKNLKYPDIYKLYEHNGRYFITVLDNSPKMSYATIIFEYLPNRNKLSKIATFPEKSVQHIEIIIEQE